MPGLSLSREAKIVVVRNGQQPPDAGNGVVAVATLYLPMERGEKATEGAMTLLGDLQFSHRLCIMGAALTPIWGWGDSSSHPLYRYREQQQVAPRWNSAMQAALQVAESELWKLVGSLKIRLKALQDAEQDAEQNAEQDAE